MNVEKICRASLEELFLELQYTNGEIWRLVEIKTVFDFRGHLQATPS